ncbi:uncharacterized protein DNG_06672 [Cephalotrichum gorgonifer]|uniref:Uncharacterized protein n=1 Tax=Cephalotrichum gorgonifer TaxID=2041049 RepID=A0AAE8SWU0_9PEZI|nr:uncharacterized protein DNG_06672 [Cephalotrichum gorgonifer]
MIRALPGATDPDARSPTPANGKPTVSQLVINRESRKPLFAKDAGTKSTSRHAHCKLPAAVSPRKPASAPSPRPSRPSSALSMKSDSGASTTPRGTRLPRPATTAPPYTRSKPLFTLEEAYRMAEKEEEEKELASIGSPGGVDASPSPAPRPWRRNKSDDANMRDAPSPSAKAAPGRPSPRSRASLPSNIPRRPGSSASQTSSTTSGSPLPRGVPDFGKRSPTTNLFGAKARIGPKVAKTGQVLAKKASNSSLDGRASSSVQGRGPAKAKGAFGSTKSGTGAGKENQRPGVGLSDGEHDAIPVPSTEPSPDARLSSSWDVLDHPSPNKSYAWEMDAEFTEGDLQVSDSPRIRIDANELTSALARPLNTKIDEIMEREAQVFNDFPLPDGTRPRPFSTRLGEIEELESKHDDLAQSQKEDWPRNTKIDEIKALEIEVLSKKALATSRLDEIRLKNSQARPRSASPVPYQPSREFAQVSTSYFNAETNSDNAGDWVEGERIPHTPVTVFPKRRQDRPRDNMVPRANSDAEDYASSKTYARDLSRDVSHRHGTGRTSTSLSTSPGPDAANRKNDGQPPQTQGNYPDTSAEPASSQHNPRKSPSPKKLRTRSSRDSDNQKLSVGFVGVRRVPSTESTQAKRSSMHSDGDPTERIEREMLLFAPADNQSDKGSIRVPSPTTSEEEEMDEDEKKTANDDAKAKGEEEDVEETPRPKKPQNILSMPTPRVTGAYVETPATVKVEPPAEKPAKAPVDSGVLFDKTKVTHRRRSLSTSGESDPEVSRDRPRAERPHRRAQSLPKHRHPLINTAKPPTVRDDIMELHRTHNIEDTTLDDFGELLASAEAPESAEISEMLEDLTDQILEEVVKKQKTSTANAGDRDRESELEAITRMTKSLQTGLLGIRSAKLGIERLEDQVAHANPDLLKNVKKRVEEEVKKEVKQEEVGQVTLVKQEVGEKKKKKPVEKVADVKQDRVTRTTSAKSPAPDASGAYLLLPVPRLFRRSPFRLTFLGVFVFTLALWYAAESAVCVKYCRPTTCSSPPCVWSINDPTFGYAIPRKLDDWTTGGQGRTLAARLSEDLSDMTADAWEFARGTDIRDVDPDKLGFEERRQYRRRLRKKGLAREWVEPEEHRAKWDAWRAERMARERASAAMEMGYDLFGESESMNDDARV